MKRVLLHFDNSVTGEALAEALEPFNVVHIEFIDDGYHFEYKGDTVSMRKKPSILEENLRRIIRDEISKDNS